MSWQPSLPLELAFLETISDEVPQVVDPEEKTASITPKKKAAPG